MNPRYSLRLKSPSAHYSHTLPLCATVQIRDGLLSKFIRLQSRYCPNLTSRPQADPTEILRPSSLSPSPRISGSSVFAAAVAATQLVAAIALPSVSQSISPSVRNSIYQSIRPSTVQPSVNRPVILPSTVRMSVRQPFSVRPSVNRLTVRPSTIFFSKIKIKFQQLLGVAVQV